MTVWHYTCIHHTINCFFRALLHFKFSRFSDCSSGGQVRFSVENQHSSGPVAQSNLLLDTFQKQRYLIVGPIFVFPLSIIVVSLIILFLFQLCVRMRVQYRCMCVCLTCN